MLRESHTQKKTRVRKSVKFRYKKIDKDLEDHESQPKMLAHLRLKTGGRDSTVSDTKGKREGKEERVQSERGREESPKTI